MKKLELALLLGLAGSICCSAFAETADSKTQLEENVLRLHILANSDSVDDQALKLKVRDSVLACTAELLEDTENTLEAVESTLAEHLDEVACTAETVVAQEGYAYPVDVQLVEMEFEDRVYENLVMPAGTYDALRITIGEAAGQNWWCVMYPALCVPNACDVDVEEETQQSYFTVEEQDLLENHERYEIRLKCLEWLEKWFS